MTTGMVMNVVSRISGSEMPSTPSEYVAWNAGIHGRCSGNWYAKLETSKPQYSGIDATNVATAMASATQRPALMPRSPNTSTSRPPAMGSQVRNERSGNPCMLLSRSLLLDQARVTNQPSMTASPMTIQNA